MTINQTPTLNIPYPDGSEQVHDGPLDFQSIAQAIDSGGAGPVMTRVVTGTLSGLPSAATVPLGSIYQCTDVSAAFMRNSGVAWTYIPMGQSTSPIGGVQAYTGQTDPVDPDGVGRWLICDGRALDRTTYSSLFSIIGTLYGVGNGTTTFNIPNPRDRAVVGAGQGAGLSSRSLASTGGAETVVANLGTHTHADGGHFHPAVDAGHTHPPASGIGFVENDPAVASVTYVSPVGSGVTVPTGLAGIRQSTDFAVSNTNVSVSSASANVQSTGASVPHNNVQSYQALHYIIRVQ